MSLMKSLATYSVDGPGQVGFEITWTPHVRSLFHSESSSYFVDSSGFKNTEGVEADIGTSIAVKDIACRSKRVRFVFMINAHAFLADRAV